MKLKFGLLTVLILLSLSGMVLAGSSDSDESDNKTKATEHYNAGVKHMKKGDDILIVGDSAFAYNYRATADAKAKKAYGKAIKEFRLATTYKEDYKEAYNNMGYCYRRIGMVGKSLQNYEQALNIDPDFAQAREYLGETLLLMDNLEKANEQLAYLQKLKSAYADTLSMAIDIYKLNQVNEQLKKKD